MSAKAPLELLKAMRDRIWQAATAPECHPRDLASLLCRVDELDKEIALLAGVNTCGDCPDPGPCDDTCPRGID